MQVQQYPPGRSVTEMEVMQFLDRGSRLQSAAPALVYFRDPGFLRYMVTSASQFPKALR